MEKWKSHCNPKLLIALQILPNTVRYPSSVSLMGSAVHCLLVLLCLSLAMSTAGKFAALLKCFEKAKNVKATSSLSSRLEHFESYVDGRMTIRIKNLLALNTGIVVIASVTASGTSTTPFFNEWDKYIRTNRECKALRNAIGFRFDDYPLLQPRTMELSPLLQPRTMELSPLLQPRTMELPPLLPSILVVVPLLIGKVVMGVVGVVVVDPGEAGEPGSEEGEEGVALLRAEAGGLEGVLEGLL
jgi:hypothetical protein